MITIMQGDEYGIAFTLKDSEQNAITPLNASDVEITIGGVTKNFLNGPITFYNGEWVFPLKQEESMNFPGYIETQVRVKFSSGDVIGEYTGSMKVLPSGSKELL